MSREGEGSAVVSRRSSCSLVFDLEEEEEEVVLIPGVNPHSQNISDGDLGQNDERLINIPSGLEEIKEDDP
jgi:hypothetical protein